MLFVGFGYHSTFGQLEDSPGPSLDLSTAVARLISERGDSAACRACGKTWAGGPPAKRNRWIRNHVEAEHLGRGVGHPCRFCSFVSKSREGLKMHMYCA